MRHISYPTPDELKLEISLNREGTDVRTEDASELHLIFSECVRGNSLPEAYEKFRQQISTRWNTAVNSATAYLVVETVVELTTRLKKTYTKELSSTSSESVPVGDPNTK